MKLSLSEDVYILVIIDIFPWIPLENKLFVSLNGSFYHKCENSSNKNTVDLSMNKLQLKQPFSPPVLIIITN